MCLRLRKNYRLREWYDELNEVGQVIGSGFYNEAMVRDGLWYESGKRTNVGWR